jgi:predicted dehydrogenase
VSGKAAGEFGHGHVDFYIPANFKGTFRETMDFPLLIDMAIHHLDLIRCVTGRDIVKVTAHSFHPSWSNYRHDCGLKLLMELEGGLPFSYSGDWSASGRATSWNGSWRLQCSEGSIHMEDDRLSLERCQSFGRDYTRETVEAAPLSHCEQGAILHAFANAIRTGKPAETNAKSNLGSYGAVVAAIRSVKEGRSINVAPLISG